VLNAVGSSKRSEWRPPTSEARGSRSALLTLLAQLLQPLPQLILNAEVHGALCRRHESGELSLLTLGHIQPLPLNLEKLIQQSPDLRLIRGVSRQHFGAQCLTSEPLLAEEAHTLSLEAIVHLSKLLHLRLVQVQSTSHDFGEPLAELLLEIALLKRVPRPWLTPIDRPLRSDR